jgi:hypothetical protein
MIRANPRLSIRGVPQNVRSDVIA